MLKHLARSETLSAICTFIHGYLSLYLLQLLLHLFLLLSQQFVAFHQDVHCFSLFHQLIMLSQSLCSHLR